MRENARTLHEAIASRGFAYVTVRGTSMLPTLRPGEVVRLERCDDPRPGHIVAFERGGVVLVHRVVRRGTEHVVCRGDNHVMEDGPSLLAAVIGRAVEVHGARRGTGARVRDDRAALVVVGARIGARRLRAQARHARAEAAWVLRQMGRQPWPERSSAQELAGLDVVASTASTPASVAIPARLYSSQSREQRIALVHERLATVPREGVLIAHGLMAVRTQRLARISAAARRCLRRFGIWAGDPGDTTWPTAEGTAHVPVCVFAPEQFTAELREAGGRVLEVVPSVEGTVKVWRATVTPGRPV